MNNIKKYIITIGFIILNLINLHAQNDIIEYEERFNIVQVKDSTLFNKINDIINSIQINEYIITNFCNDFDLKSKWEYVEVFIYQPADYIREYTNNRTNQLRVDIYLTNDLPFTDYVTFFKKTFFVKAEEKIMEKLFYRTNNFKTYTGYLKDTYTIYNFFPILLLYTNGDLTLVEDKDEWIRQWE